MPRDGSCERLRHHHETLKAVFFSYQLVGKAGSLLKKHVHRCVFGEELREMILLEEKEKTAHAIALKEKDLQELPRF